MFALDTLFASSSYTMDERGTLFATAQSINPISTTRRNANRVTIKINDNEFTKIVKKNRLLHLGRNRT